MKMKHLHILFILFMAVSLPAYAEEKTATQYWVKVAPIKVCMVNDQVFEKDQIPVEVEGKTYYGCCKMCKQTLTEKKEFRTGIDPVSGKQVDKATAVIGATKKAKLCISRTKKPSRNTMPKQISRKRS